MRYLEATAILAIAPLASAHVAAWTKGMYCLNGTKEGVEDLNTNTAANPLHNLTMSEWWMQHDRGCDQAPPDAGDSLALPAGGSFTVELAINRAFTSLSYNGSHATQWPDGEEHPEDWTGPGADSCLKGAAGALHTHNRSTAAGTAWAISYHSNITNVTMENLAVFSVLEHTPWERNATYAVPADLPACPDGGCYCAWLWVPRGCGEENIYMQNFRCHVTGARSTNTRKIAAAKPPVYCADDASKCVPGAKQMIAWKQRDGNNVQMPAGVSPGYGPLMGFQPGCQDDIFEPVTDDANLANLVSNAEGATVAHLDPTISTFKMLPGPSVTGQPPPALPTTTTMATITTAPKLKASPCSSESRR